MRRNLLEVKTFVLCTTQPLVVNVQCLETREDRDDSVDSTIRDAAEDETEVFD